MNHDDDGIGLYKKEKNADFIFIKKSGFFLTQNAGRSQKSFFSMVDTTVVPHNMVSGLWFSILFQVLYSKLLP